MRLVLGIWPVSPPFFLYLTASCLPNVIEHIVGSTGAQVYPLIAFWTGLRMVCGILEVGISMWNNI